MTVTRTFLAWYRSGLATALTAAPATGSARADLPAQISMAGTPFSARVPVQLAGPGDVAGLDAREVRRCEPFDGCADFEPAYFAYLELVSPDLPWRFSPLGPLDVPLPDPEHPSAPPAIQRRLQPWLALVVVPADRVAVAPPGAGGLPVLSCDADELPDPAEAWAWAHVQVTTVDGSDPAQAAGDPARSFARLLCPRRLEPAMSYRAFLVPTFSAGLTPAGLTATSPPLGPAWTAPGPVNLPIYFSYSFTTGQGGSFETLARRLRPRPAPPSAAGTAIATGAPGWDVVGAPDATTVMQGALRPLAGPGSTESAPDPALAGQLAAAVSTTQIGLQLRPPIYGQDYAGGAGAVRADSPGWLAQLNTDPRRRLAAGLAAWAVAVEQDDLVDRAWQQLATAGLRVTTTAAPDLAAILLTALSGRTAGTVGASLPAAMARMARPGGPLSPTGMAAALAATTLAQPAAVTVTAAAAERFAPIFDEPAYSHLRAVAAEWLLPGAGDIPADSVVVLRTNPAFSEAFLVGLNHALSRELIWRRYPLDPTATMFNRFWAAAPNGGDQPPTPIGDWPAGSDLGAHTSVPDELVLLVRGALLQRFPTAAVYLAGQQPDGNERHVPPNLAANLGPGASFVGFPITPDAALHPTPGDNVTAWSVVIQEAVDHPRFGCDDPPTDNSTATVTGWQDLDWAYPQLIGRTYVPVNGPLAGVTRPLTGTVSPVAVPTATWGADAAHMAAALARPAYRIRIPISLWLTPPPTPQP